MSLFLLGLEAIAEVDFQGVEKGFTLFFELNEFVELLEFVSLVGIEAVKNLVVYTYFSLLEFFLGDFAPEGIPGEIGPHVLFIKSYLLLVVNCVDVVLVDTSFVNLIVELFSKNMTFGELLLYVFKLDFLYDLSRVPLLLVVLVHSGR